MLTIIIVHYNAPCALRDCLNALKNANLEIPMELIIIDNASAHSPRPLIEFFNKFFEILFIENRINLGYARAVNQGLKKARGEFILIINPDILIPAGAIEEMVKYLEREPEVGLLAPALFYPDGSVQRSCFRWPRFYTPFVRRTFLKCTPWGKRELERYLMVHFECDRIEKVDWVLGAAMMVKKSAIRKVGLMDERFFLYFEDVDWCRRFAKQNLRVVYFPRARFLHKYARISAQGGGLWMIFNKYFWLHTISYLRYFIKWHICC
ncbi:MAG: glycosyltransferase family 2 protein [candidate division WOR-3 bacterium]